MTYNGWSNRETWNVNLWLSNDEGLYREVNRIARRYEGTEADPEDGAEAEAADIDGFSRALQTFCKDLWPNNETPDGAALSECDFDEVAQSWLEE